MDCKFVLSVLVLECNTSIAQYSMFLVLGSTGIGIAPTISTLCCHMFSGLDRMALVCIDCTSCV